MEKITTIAALESRYGVPPERSLWKEIDHVNEHYQAFIRHSPFLILATVGEQGVDCSPRGDAPGFVRVVSETCLQIPDRRGNNRLDSLRNIIHNPQVGLIFMVPNAGEAIRVSGKAEIIVDEALCASFAVNGKPASSVLSVTVEKAYFQCQKAIARSQLWDSASYIERSELPSVGQMIQHFADQQQAEFDGQAYDTNYPEYMKKTIY